MNPNEEGKYPTTVVAVTSSSEGGSVSPHTLLLAWLIAAVMVMGIYVGVFLPKAANNSTDRTKSSSPYNHTMGQNCNGSTVIAWRPPTKAWEVIQAQRLKEYETECHRLLEDYSRLLETIETTTSNKQSSSSYERILVRRWTEDLEKIARYTQQQQLTLKQMLVSENNPFLYTLALPAFATETTSSRLPLRRDKFVTTNTAISSHRNDPPSHPIRLPPTPGGTNTTEHSYDSIHQMLAHLVRDWSNEGHGVRNSLYQWCIERIPDEAERILVPGAGLGRLAWELLHRPTTTNQSTQRVVHAIEMSWMMVAVFHTAVMGKPLHAWTIFPYLNDFWTNQVSCDTRFHPVQIPNVDLTRNNSSNNNNMPRLSWTIADFLDVTRVPEEASSYDAVVTCFFLDTATNVLEYIRAIHSVLATGGRWINVGPLHWHGNARLVLTVDDLRTLLKESSLWNILEWSVDTDPLEYRSTSTTPGSTVHGGPTPTSTRYEAYRPLRFVLEKQR